jgi:hypothetical protein
MLSVEQLRAWVIQETVEMIGEDEGFTVPQLVCVPAEQAEEALERVYGEDWDERQEEELEATHLIRFVYQIPGVPLVDGDDWWVKIGEDDSIELLTEVDHPAFHGGKLSEAIEWCNELL